MHRKELFAFCKHWYALSRNKSEAAIRLLEANPDKKELVLNESEGIRLMEVNADKINWEELVLNSSEEAIRLLEANPDLLRQIS